MHYLNVIIVALNTIDLLSKKSIVAKYALKTLSEDTRLHLREKTINCRQILQKPK